LFAHLAGATSARLWKVGNKKYWDVRQTADTMHFGGWRLALDGKLPFDAKKMLTYMITKGKYFLSICIRKN